MKDLHEEILYGFNFFKVQKVMETLLWSYYNTEVPPTRNRLRKTVGELLETLEEQSDWDNASTGGFEIEEYEDRYVVRFIAHEEAFRKDDVE